MSKSETKRIKEFMLMDHGVRDTRYEPYCPILGKRFTNIAVGTSNTVVGAIEHCIKQVAEAGFDTDGLRRGLLRRSGWESLITTPDDCFIGGPGGELVKPHYCVSIWWNAKE